MWPRDKWTFAPFLTFGLTEHCDADAVSRPRTSGQRQPHSEKWFRRQDADVFVFVLLSVLRNAGFKPERWRWAWSPRRFNSRGHFRTIQQGNDTFHLTMIKFILTYLKKLKSKRKVDSFILHVTTQYQCRAKRCTRQLMETFESNYERVKG